jgi:hypothetical protein|uniref:VQ domain-containing protein n=2 Tax=Zea mays TaxID=4577 RepID=A0A804PVX1_MAIZE
MYIYKQHIDHEDGAPWDAMPPTRPKIKIIHIITPEIMKTDVAHFRAFMQRLTGKPACCSDVTSTPPPPVGERRRQRRPRRGEADTGSGDRRREERFHGARIGGDKERKIKCEVKVEDRKELGFDGYEYELGRSDLWMDMDLSPGGGFLSFL